MHDGSKKNGLKTVLSGNVLMLGVVSFFTDISSEMIYPLLPVFFTGLVSVSSAAIYIGLMEGVAESVSSLLKIWSGRLSDATGKRKPVVLFGYGVSTVARPLMALAMAGWHVIAFRFLDRVGKGIRTSARDALISDSADIRVRGLAFSFHRAMDHAGAVIGPVLATGILYAFLGHGLWSREDALASPEEIRALRWLFGIALIPGLAAMAALLGKVKEIPQKNNSPAVGTLTDCPSLRLPKRFYLYLASVTVFTLGNSSDLFLIFFARTRFHLGMGHVIGLWVLLHISKIVFSVPGGMLSDRWGRRPAIVTGWGVYILVYAGMAFLSELWCLWGLLALYGLYYGLTEGAERALVADYVPCEYRGRAYGLYHGAVGLAALPASLLFGVFWAELGPRIAFMTGAGLAAVATGMMVVFLSGKQKI